MLLTDIQKLLNNTLAGETLTLKEMLPHLDYAIDEINSNMNSCFPTFTELVNAGENEYVCFPDMYIRQVVIPGAAWNYYVTDEEGLQTAQQYQINFEKGKFIMQRDMLYTIPEEYQADRYNGYIVGNPSNPTVGERGLTVDFNF